MLLNGRTSASRQKFLCPCCKLSFVFRNNRNKEQREKKWFNDWILEGYSVRQLNLISGRSVRTLKRIIAHWLAEKPPNILIPYPSLQYLIGDGTYLKHENCVYTVIDYPTGLVIANSYGVKENYHMAKTMFGELKASGCLPVAITLDGNTQVIRAVREVWPNIIVQRCLYHILRQGASWLRRFPKDHAAKELRKIVLTVTAITDNSARDVFLNQLNEWEHTYGAYVQTLDSRHKIYGDLQRTRSLLWHALPDMFHYLRDAGIAPTSNKQEGLFSAAKILFRNHRGVKKENRRSYFNWYFHLKNKNIINH
ncbi:MAG: transposase [Patescibacteria group bacterium]